MVKIIDDLLEVGDEVVIDIPDENWEGGYRPVSQQHGTHATVVGFSEIVYSRIDNFGFPPGVYRNGAWTKLKLEDGEEHTELTSRLTMVDQAVYEARTAEQQKTGVKDWLDSKERLRDLPETKFWEGDEVLVYGGTRGVVSVSLPDVKDETVMKNILDGNVPDDVKPMIVIGIEYDWKEGDKPWAYRVSDSFGSGWNTMASEPDMMLVSRGNVWKYFNGQELVFESIQEEASFFKMLGHYTEVANPESGMFSWTLEEVLAGIKKGVVDGFYAGLVPFSFGKRSIDAIKYRDEELGERVREATLAGFDSQ